MLSKAILSRAVSGVIENMALDRGTLYTLYTLYTNYTFSAESRHNKHANE